MSLGKKITFFESQLGLFCTVSPVCMHLMLTRDMSEHTSQQMLHIQPDDHAFPLVSLRLWVPWSSFSQEFCKDLMRARSQYYVKF